MRGRDQSSGNLFSYVDLEERVPDDHPLRLIREIVNDVLGSLSSEFETLYSHMGRPSIPPEKLLRALLLQAFYSIRSERQLMEQLNFNMQFCWFVGLGLDDGVWDASAFCHNRDRLLEAEVSAQLLAGVIQHHKVGGLLSRDHFSVDGTLIEAWASMKSFRPKGEDDGDGGSGRNAERDFHGEKRSNATHASTTDPDARLYRKGNGRESKLCYMGHALTENRHGLAVGGGVTIASGTAEREAALDLIDRHRPVESRGGRRRITVGGDKGFDVADFVEELRHRKVTPHIAVQDHVTKTGKRRKTKIDGRTTRHPGSEPSFTQTRLRYVLFVPWIYRQLEARRTAASHVPTQLRKAELDLIGPLLENGTSQGVIGERARESLARQPSSVYWTALIRWGLFLHARPQGWYHTHFTGLLHGRGAEETADDPGVIRSRQPNWHPRLPRPPQAFPYKVFFDLTREEAAFLQGRLEDRCAGTLLAWLAREGSDAPSDGCFWDDSAATRAPADLRHTIELARRFSLHVEGMPLLYNLLTDAPGASVIHAGQEHLASQRQRRAGRERSR